MKLARAEIENFQKITVIDITFGDRVTEISGKNGAGKSSVFAALHACLQQLAMPADPIRHGAETCAIRTHLKGDDGSILLVTKRLREDRTGKVVADLVLETPEGARYPQAATHLKQLIGDHLLDPLKVLDMDQDKLLEVLKSFVTGFDFEANKRLYDGLFAKRTDVNKDQKREQAAADSIAVPEGTPETEANVVELSAELEAAIAHNNDCATRKTNRENAQVRIAELRSSADSHLTAIETDAAEINRKADGAIEEIDNQIAVLKARRERIENQRQADADSNRQMHEEAAASRRASAVELEQKITAAGEPKAPYTDENLAAKRKAIADAQVTNKHVAAAKTKRAHLKKAAGLAVESLNLTKRLGAIEQEREDAVRKANLPVAGLGIGDGFVTFNGAPFEQASQGDRMRTAFALVAAKQAGELKFCWISDASLLDDDNRALIEQLAEEFDCQVLLETVKPGSSNAIILEDGHVQGMAQEPKLTAFAKPDAIETGAAAEQSAAGPDDPKPKKRRTWQGPGAPTGDAA